MINKNKKLTNNIKFNRRKEINKMKTRIFTICIMVVALAMFAPVANADFKATGGGYIKILLSTSDYSRPTFGFQMKCKGDGYSESTNCVGNLQYNDRDFPIKIHSTEVSVGGPIDGVDGGWYFEGDCRIQSEWVDLFGNYFDEDGTFRLEVSVEGIAIEILGRNVGEYLLRDDTNDFVKLGGGSINIQRK